MGRTFAILLIALTIGATSPAGAQVQPFPNPTIGTTLEALAGEVAGFADGVPADGSDLHQAGLGTIVERNDFRGAVTPSSDYSSGTATENVELSGSEADAGVVGSAKVQGLLCPDASGKVSGTVTASLDQGSGANAEHDQLTIKFEGTVDDSAHLTGFELNARFNGGSLQEPTTRRAWRSSAQARGKRAHTSSASFKVTEPGDATEKELDNEISSTTGKAKRLIRAYLREAERAWRGGKCVEIKVIKGASRKVKVRERVPIEAEARPRQGGGVIERPMTATLISGAQSVSPARDAGRPAHFIYVAPPKRNRQGTVELRSISRRGIGFTNLTYKTESDLKVSGNLYGGTYTGVKCDGPAGEWNIDGEAPGNPRRVDKITVVLGEDDSGTYHQVSEYYTAGNPAPTTSEVGGGARYDENANTMHLDLFGDLHVEEGTYCKNA